MKTAQAEACGYKQKTTAEKTVAAGFSPRFGNKINNIEGGKGGNTVEHVAG